MAVINGSRCGQLVTGVVVINEMDVIMINCEVSMEVPYFFDQNPSSIITLVCLLQNQ